jgi:hypothetical protein
MLRSHGIYQFGSFFGIANIGGDKLYAIRNGAGGGPSANGYACTGLSKAQGYGAP